ncbi:MAG: hypothetical protein LAP85_27915 [Acidobacteriia bacterium]|nr:hypothetical protein [Terriglobia bacterium]
MPASYTIGYVGFVIVCLAGGALLARRNLRMGRGDRPGAARLAFFAFGMSEIAWVFGEHHVPTAGELTRLIMSAGSALFSAGALWLVYVAMEPFVRHRWPGSLVAWNRLLAGSLRDPLVGRDLLVGCIGGVAWVVLNYLMYPVATWFGAPQVQPWSGMNLGTLYLFSGVHAIVAGVSGLLIQCAIAGFLFLFLLFMLRVLLRRTWAAAIAWSVITATMWGFAWKSLPIELIFFALINGVALFILKRFGLVANAAQTLFGSLLFGFPITTHLSAWYSGIGLKGLGLLLAMTLYAFHTSLGGRPLFSHAILKD